MKKNRILSFLLAMVFVVGQLSFYSPTYAAIDGWTIESLDDISDFELAGPENTVMTFYEPADVAYGADGSYYVIYGFEGEISFSNGTFSDPKPGVVKNGYYRYCGDAFDPETEIPAAVLELENYVDVSKYSAESQAEINEIISTSIPNIEAVTTRSEMNKVLKNAKSQIDLLVKPILYEGFDYTAGLTRPDGVGLSVNNWTSAWSGNEARFTIVEGSLQYEDSKHQSLETVGNMMQHGTRYICNMNRSFFIPSATGLATESNTIGQNDTTVYMSCIMQSNKMIPRIALGSYLSNGYIREGSFNGGQAIKIEGYNGKFCLVNNNQEVCYNNEGNQSGVGKWSQPIVSNVSIESDKVYFLVLKMSFAEAGNKFELFVNPNLGEPLGTPDCVLEDNISYSINYLYLDDDSDSSNAYFDEFRLGKTYESVLPSVGLSLRYLEDKVDEITKYKPISMFEKQEAKDTVNEKIEIASAKIMDAETSEEVETIVTAYKEELDLFEIEYRNTYLDEARVLAKAELKEYPDYTLYQDGQLQEINQLLENAYTQIDSASTWDAIKMIVVDTKAIIDTVLSADQLAEIEHPTLTEGNGTSDDPYLIYSMAQLKAFSEVVANGKADACAKLMRDINMENYDEPWIPIGIYSDHRDGVTMVDQSKLGKNYSGIFDGNYHVIKNLKIEITDTLEGGLFGRTWGATIKNLGMVDCVASNMQGVRIGILGGEIYGSTVSNCFIAGDKSSVTGTGRQVAAFAGEAAGGTQFINCYTTLTCAPRYQGEDINCYWGKDYDASAFESGEIAFLLNESSSDSPVYYQNIDASGVAADKYPVFKNTNAVQHGTVYSYTKTDLTTVYSNTEYISVSYYDVYNNHLKTDNVIKGQAIGTLPKIFRDGYEFEGWYLDNIKIGSDFVVEEAIVLKPKFTKETIKSSTYTIVLGDNVEYSTINGYDYIDGSGMEDALTLADKVVFKAVTDEGQNVDYWTINDQVISNEQTLGFMVQPGTMKVGVVLKDVGAPNTKTIDPNVIITSTVSRPDHNNRFYVYSMRMIEDASNLVECGVIILRGVNAESDVGKNITLETNGIHQIKSSRQGNMGEYAIVRKDTETQYSVRSYMKYKDSNGEEKVVYSEAVTVEMPLAETN